MYEQPQTKPRQLVEMSAEIIRENRLPWEKKLGILYWPVYNSKNCFRRFTGKFSKEDQLNLACSCEPPLFF
jgi:hypothetical protein